jgi:hypothetical protein
MAGHEFTLMALNGVGGWFIADQAIVLFSVVVMVFGKKAFIKATTKLTKLVNAFHRSEC